MKDKEAAISILVQGRQRGLTYREIFDAASVVILTLAQIMHLDEEELRGELNTIIRSLKDPKQPLPEEMTESLHREYLEEEKE